MEKNVVGTRLLSIKYILLLIIGIGGILRFWGLWYGQPYSFYGDEIHFVKRALSFGSGDFNPHWFHKPAFFMYLLFFEYGLLFVYGKVTSMWSSVNDFAVYYIDNPWPFYIIGRITVVCFSLLTVWITWILSRRFFGQIAAVISALIVAISFGPIASAKNVKADAPCAFFTILSCYFLLRYIENNVTERSKILFLSLATVSAGVGAATKTYSLPMIVVISLVILFCDSHGMMSRIKRIILQVILIFLTYFICSPFNFLDAHGRKSTFGPIISIFETINHWFFKTETSQVAVVSREVQNVDHSVLDFLRGGVDYVATLSHGLNPFILVLSVIGFFFVIKHKNRAGAILLIYPAIFMAVSILLNPGYADLRHQLPLISFVAIIAGFAFEKLSRYKTVSWALILCITAFSAYDLNRVIKYNKQLSQPDIRNMSQKWIEKNIMAGTKVLIDEDGPYIRRSPDQLDETLKKAKSHGQGPFTTHYSKYLEYQQAANHGKTSYNIFKIRMPWWRKDFLEEGVHKLDSEFDADMGNPLKMVGVLDYTQYIEQGYEYAIILRHNYDGFLDNETRYATFPFYGKLYENILSRGEKIKSFSGLIPSKHPGKFNSTSVDIFRLN